MIHVDQTKEVILCSKNGSWHAVSGPKGIALTPGSLKSRFSWVVCSGAARGLIAKSFTTGMEGSGSVSSSAPGTEKGGTGDSNVKTTRRLRSSELFGIGQGDTGGFCLPGVWFWDTMRGL